MNIPGELIPIVLFIMVPIIIKISGDINIRRKLIETGNVNESARYLFTDSFERHVPSSLKWGIVLIGLGTAILIGQLVPYHISDEVTISCMFIFAGLGLVTYYVIASRIVENQRKEEL